MRRTAHSRPREDPPSLMHHGEAYVLLFPRLPPMISTASTHGLTIPLCRASTGGCADYVLETLQASGTRSVV